MRILVGACMQMHMFFLFKYDLLGIRMCKRRHQVCKRSNNELWGVRLVENKHSANLHSGLACAERGIMKKDAINWKYSSLNLILEKISY